MLCPSLCAIDQVAPDACSRVFRVRACLTEGSGSQMLRALRLSHYATSPGRCAMHSVVLVRERAGMLIWPAFFAGSACATCFQGSRLRERSGAGEGRQRSGSECRPVNYHTGPSCGARQLGRSMRQPCRFCRRFPGNCLSGMPQEQETSCEEGMLLTCSSGGPVSRGICFRILVRCASDPSW